MTCGADGVRSLLALAHSADLATGAPDEPVLAHVTVCQRHLAAVREWLRGRSEDGQVQTVATEKLLRHWGQIVDPVQLPVWGTARAN